MVQMAFVDESFPNVAMANVNEPAEGGEESRRGSTPSKDMPPKGTQPEPQSVQEDNPDTESENATERKKEDERSSIPGLNQDENMRETAGGRIVDDEPPL